MSLDLVQLGRTIREVRRAAGLTQPELGQRAGGISAVAISQIEKGQTAPALVRVAEIAAALNVGIGVLFGDPLAMAEHTVAQVRPAVRALGYDIALIPREDS